MRSKASWDSKVESKKTLTLESLQHPDWDLGGTDTRNDERPTTSAQLLVSEVQAWTDGERLGWHGARVTDEPTRATGEQSRATEERSGATGERAQQNLSL